MVRPMTIRDIPRVAERAEEVIKHLGRNPKMVSQHRVSTVISDCVRDKCAFISEDGWVFGRISPDIWDAGYITLTLLNIYATNPYQGGKLMLAFNNKASELLQQGTIDEVVAHHIGNKTGIDYTRLGYQKFDTRYIRR